MKTCRGLTRSSYRGVAVPTPGSVSHSHRRVRECRAGVTTAMGTWTAQNSRDLEAEMELGEARPPPP